MRGTPCWVSPLPHRDSPCVDVMFLADDPDRLRDIGRRIATAAHGDLPPIGSECLAGLPEAFEQLTAFVDHDLVDELDTQQADAREH